MNIVLFVPLTIFQPWFHFLKILIKKTKPKIIYNILIVRQGIQPTHQ